MKSLFTIVLAGLIAFAAPDSIAGSIKVTTTPVPLNSEDPNQTDVGKLRYRGGIAMRSSDATFGGLSGLAVSANGKRLFSVTDRGRRLAARIVYGENGDLAGLRRTDLDTLSGLDGEPLKAKSESDAESISPGVEGEIIVSFERRHRLWRYMPGQVLPEPLPPPDELADMKKNSGIEALTLLADGSLIAITEGSNKSDSALAWISSAEGWSVMTYVTNDKFRPTGAATMANGDVLVLERRFTLRDGVAVRIGRLKGTSIRAGARLRPQIIAELRPPLTVDNFEGIEVRQSADGRNWIYIISDDNFSPLQQNLLMMFELME